MQIEQMKAQWTAQIDLTIGENTQHAKALLEQIRLDILEQMRPPKINENDINSSLHKREQSFERLCYQLRKHNVHNPESLSTYSFYSSVMLMKEEIDAHNRQQQQ